MAGIKQGCSRFFETQLSPEKKQKPDVQSEVLILAPDTCSKKICFENVKVKSSVTGELILRNPTTSDLNIELQKLPDPDKGFTWSATDFVIPAGEDKRLVISWTPEEGGNLREVIKLFDKKKNESISEFIIISSAVEPKKVAKRDIKGKPLRTRNVLPQYSFDSATVTKQSNPVLQNNENKENVVSIIDISNIIDQNTDVQNQHNSPVMLNSCNYGNQYGNQFGLYSENFKTEIDDMTESSTDIRLISSQSVESNDSYTLGIQAPSTKQTNEMFPILPSLEANFKVPEVLNISPPMQRKLSCIVNKLSPSITSRRSLPNRLQQQGINSARKVPIKVKEATPTQKPRKSAQDVTSTVKRKATSGPISLPMKTLRLSFNSPSTKKIDNGQTPDEVIQKMINPEPFFAYTTLDPSFLAGNALVKTEHNNITAAIKIQNFYRNYLLMRTQRRLFLKQKSAALQIQEYFRGYRQMQIERSRFMQKKNGTIIIQRCWRQYRIAKAEHFNCSKIRSLVIKIQQFYRNYRITKLVRCKFLQLKSAAIKIQNFFRGYLTMKFERNRFLKLKLSALTLVKYWRSYVAAKAERTKFVQIKSSVIKIQRYYRSYKLMKHERSKYLKTRSSIIKIQQFYRKYRITKLERYRFLQLKSAVIKIQNFYRGYLAMKFERNRFLKLKSSALTLQKYWRTYVAAKAERTNFLQIKSSVIKIQRYYRLYRTMKRKRSQFLHLKSCVITMQRKFRSSRVMNIERVEYLKLKSAVYKIQLYYKNYKATKLHRSRFLKQKSAAVLIQAAWRGYYLRKNLQTKKKPEKSVTDHKTLRRRFNDAVSILQHNMKSLHLVMKCLITLDTVTLLSSQLCEDLVDQGLVKTLYNVFVMAHNRSEGDVLACETAVMVLVNLYKYAYVATAVWKTTVEVKGIKTLVRFLLKSYSKNTTLFCNIATLLWLFAHDNENVKVIKSTHNVLQVLNYISKELNKKKKDIKKKKHTIPDTKPDWGKYGDKPRVFLDKHIALEKLLKKMDI